MLLSILKSNSNEVETKNSISTPYAAKLLLILLFSCQCILMVELLIVVSDKRTTFVGPALQSAFLNYLVKKQDNEWGNQSTSSISLTI